MNLLNEEICELKPFKNIKTSKKVENNGFHIVPTCNDLILNKKCRFHA